MSIHWHDDEVRWCPCDELDAKQERILTDINNEIEAGIADMAEDMPDVNPDDVFADLAESAMWSVDDPAVRAEFHRRHGLVDRRTGIDHMGGV